MRFLTKTISRAVASALGLVAAIALLAAGFAYAQSTNYTLPVWTQALTQQDLLQILPRGAPTAQNQYIPLPQVGGVEDYSYQVPLTAFSITPANGVSLLYLNPAGTLATGTLTMPATPADGQRFILEDSQTQTAITISANTGQTLASGTFGLTTPTALVANTRYQWMFIGSLSTWVRTS